MTYLVKRQDGRYLCLVWHRGSPGVWWTKDRKHATRLEAPEAARRAGESRQKAHVVRLLTHEESKRKAVAQALREAAEAVKNDYPRYRRSHEILLDRAAVAWPR